MTADLTSSFAKLSDHYFWDIAIDGKLVTAVVDTGSNSTIVSKGACDVLGLNIIKNN